MQPSLFTIERALSGRLSTMAHPRGGEWLADEMGALSRAGVDVLVSLLTEDEERELHLGDEQRLAQAAGLTFRRLRTADLSVPARMATLALASELVADLAAGREVAVHCRMGIGRASTLAATVLVQEGVPAADAWRRITAARGLPVPDTQEQVEFVDAVAAGHHGGGPLSRG